MSHKLRIVFYLILNPSPEGEGKALNLCDIEARVAKLS
jgi:hypothetical protein